MTAIIVPVGGLNLPTEKETFWDAW